MPDDLRSPEPLSVEGFLAKLARRDVRLWLDEGALRFDAPQGAMTDELLAEVRARKPDIVAFLAEAQRLREGGGGAEETIPPAPAAEAYPVSFAQRRLWYMQRLAPENPFYNAPALLELSGRLDAAALRTALAELIARHEILRTVYQEGPDGDPVQLVRPAGALPLPETDLRELGAEEQQTRLAELAHAAATAPFDLGRDLPLRAELVRTAGETWVLLLTLHHIVSDGWSIGVMVRELQALYGAQVEGAQMEAARAELPDLPIQYKDFAAWQRRHLSGARLEALTGHWRRTLEGAPTSLNLPADARPEGSIHARGGAEAFRLERATADRLAELARQEQATLFMTAAAGFASLLARLTGQEELLLGAAVANRTRRELEGLIGFFVNTLPLRLDLSGDPSFRELVRQVRSVALEAFAHQELPFDLLVSALQPERETARTPLVQAVLVVQNAPGGSWRLPGLSVRPLPPPVQSARNDLELHVWEVPASAEHDGGLGGILYYDAGRFSQATARGLAAQMRTILEAQAATPDAPALAVPLISPAEQQRLLAGPVPPPPAPPEAPVTAAIAAAAAARPEAVALESGTRRLTYAELEAQAEAVARALAGRGLAPGRVVGLWMTRGPEAIVALLGCWKAGVAYVPLAPDDPPARVAELLAEAEAPLAFADPELSGAEVGVPLLTLEAALSEAGAADVPEVGLDTLAYLLFTSGSTGRPKGVLVGHRGLANLARAQAEAFGIGPDSRVLQFAPLTFDASVSEIVIALSQGATLCLEPREAMLPGAPLAELLRDKRITKVTLPPSVLAVLPDTALPDLRTLVVAGEACAPELARRWGAGRRLLNAYGPTENTVCATIHDGPPGGLRLPIGRPMPGVEVWLLDPRGQPVPPGLPGELHLGGLGLAQGYLDRPEETAARFRPHPFGGDPEARLYATGDLARYDADGVIEFLGRIDSQVKLRGMRVEPGEIEHRLLELPAVREAAVVVAGGTAETDRLAARLAAFVVPDPAHEPPGEDESGDEAHLAEAHLNDWRNVFDSVLTDETPPDGTALFNHAGWRRSDTGEAFGAAEMRAWCADALAAIEAREPEAILELGCGSGMLLWSLAGRCRRYRGIDLSPEAVAYIERQAAAHAPRFDHVEAAVGTADDPPGVEDGAYDLVLLHSVVQYFPDADYLRRVIARALRALKPGGTLLLGDVRNHALHRTFETAMARAVAPGSEPEALRRAVADRLAAEQELLVHPGFFTALAAESPQIAACRFRLQRGAAGNELNRYRYTVLLETAPALDFPDAEPQDGRGVGLEELRAQLRDAAPDTVAWSGLGNALLAPDLTAEAQLFEDAAPAPDEAGVTPEALYALAEDLGYAAEVSWTRDPGDGRLDAVFHRPGTPAPRLPLAQHGPLRRPETGTNEPMAARRAAALVRHCRRHLEAHLSPHMVPPVLEVRPRLPLSRHGKIDRAALAAEAAQAGAPPPRQAGSDIEAAVAEVFAETLGLPAVAVDADFFRLGGHSLLAVGLADRLGKRFGVSVPLAELVARPTPAAVAALLEDGEAEERPVSPLLVRLGGGRKGRPLFLLPPAAGSPLCYLDFAVGLASAAPVWGLQCPGLNTAERPLARVDALAEAFAEAIRSVQPHGPYRLAGWSFGGVPAYAVAARLAAEGEPVEFVALLDSGLSAEGGPKPRGTARLVKGLRDLLGLGVLVLQVGKFRRFEDICRLAQAAGISLPRSWQAARRWTTWREALGQAWRSAVVFKANMAAAKAYAAPAYAGHVVLFRAAPEWASDPVIQDVERHAMGQITVRHVTGNHMTIMLHPQEVARFAQAFAETLESIQAGSGGGKEAATVPRVSKQGDSAP